MRLRIRVERNELPAVSALWTIGDTEQRQTVAQFLERVNERFPLEGETWGLEDYSITVAGYEALHFQEVGTCFQNEDEVVIKPLQFVDVKARIITGRTQISEDGRHLVDGVPFGRPLLKRGRRPDVWIPPRKRQRLAEGEAVANEAEQAVITLDDLEDESEDDDVDFESDDDEAETGSEESEEEIPAKRNPTNKRQLLNIQKKDTIEDQRAASSPSVDSDGEDSVTTDEDSSDSSDISTSSESDDTSSEASEESWFGIEQSDPFPAVPTLSSSVQTSSGSVTLIDTPPEELSSRGTSQGIPYKGAARTQARNSRRRDQRRLKHLKEAGSLPGKATLDDMFRWQEQNGLTTGNAVKSEAQRQRVEITRQLLLNEISSGGVDVSEDRVINGASDVELSDDRTPGDIDGFTVSTPPHKRRKVPNGLTTDSTDAIDPEMRHAATNGALEEPTADEAVTKRRARLEAAGTERLIFGSLGVRPPKTREDRDALQKKLAGAPSRASKSGETNEVEEAAEAVDEDPIAWRNKVQLSAVECCDDSVTLSTPPFPFKQRWDPQYQYTQKMRPKKKKIVMTNGAFVETYDKYNANGDDALDYDDPTDADLDDDHWEDGALLENGYDEVDDEFPALPADLAVLPALTEADAKQGDIIIFEELAVSAATGWSPATVIRTVRLVTNSEDGWHVKLAPRDLPPREYDDEGKRVYSNFEMAGLSDDEDDQDEKTMRWDAMANSRLLLRSNE